MRQQVGGSKGKGEITIHLTETITLDIDNIRRRFRVLRPPMEYSNWYDLDEFITSSELIGQDPKAQER